MNGSLKAVSDHNFDYWNSNQIFTGRWTKWRKWQPEIILISNSQLFPTFMSCGTNNMSGASALVCVLTLYLVACVLWQPCLFDPKINMLFQKAMKPVDKYACWIILVVIGISCLQVHQSNLISTKSCRMWYFLNLGKNIIYHLVNIY